MLSTAAVDYLLSRADQSRIDRLEDQDSHGRHVMDGPEQDREDYAEMVGGRVWDQPWFQWSVAIDPVGPILGLTSCGAAGQFDSEFRASPISMRSVGTEDVWTRLVLR